MSRLRAKAAIAPNTRIAVTATVVTMMLLPTYVPNPPRSHAVASTDRSIDVGSDQGESKICCCVLKDDITIQTSGTTKTSEMVVITA